MCVLSGTRKEIDDTQPCGFLITMEIQHVPPLKKGYKQPVQMLYSLIFIESDISFFFLQHKQEGESFILNFQIIHAPGFVKYLNKSKFVAMIFLTWHERAYLVSDEEQILIQCGKKSVCWLLLINHIKESDDYSKIHHKHTQIHKKDKNNYQEWCSWLIKVVWQKTWLWKCMAYKSNTGTTRYPEVTVHAH